MHRKGIGHKLYNIIDALSLKGEKLGVSKLLECRILHQIPQSFWGP